MDNFIDLLSSIPGELWTGFGTAGIGYMAHRYKVISERHSSQTVKEELHLKYYEAELNNIAEKQEKINEFFESSIESLKKDREKLQNKVDILEAKIGVLGLEVLDWKLKYETCKIELNTLKSKYESPNSG